jgi:hypothetical protein
MKVVDAVSCSSIARNAVIGDVSLREEVDDIGSKPQNLDQYCLKCKFGTRHSVLDLRWVNGWCTSDTNSIRNIYIVSEPDLFNAIGRLSLPVQPMSDCRKGVCTWREFNNAPVLASRVRIQFWLDARKRIWLPPARGV